VSRKLFGRLKLLVQLFLLSQLKRHGKAMLLVKLPPLVQKHRAALKLIALKLFAGPKPCVPRLCALRPLAQKPSAAPMQFARSRLAMNQ
jgi:hypothetical protein